MSAWVLPMLCGTAAGVLSAWGIGGGTLLLLCMTLLLGVEQAEAQAINLLFFLPTAAASLIYHRKGGYLDPEILKCAVPAGTLCALAASLLATALDLSVLRKPFGALLLLAALSILIKKEKPG